jgi:hypothetical protein
MPSSSPAPPFESPAHHEPAGWLIAIGDFHGPSHLPEERPKLRAHRIHIDTGAGYRGPRTAMDLPSQWIWQTG